MNAAYSERYLSWRSRCESTFRMDTDAFRREAVLQETRDGRYQVKTRFYEYPMDGFAMHGCEKELYDGQGKLLYRWRNLDDCGDFFQNIRHSNGKEYLIFRRDLYGYSVLELESMEELHYLPEKAFPEEKRDFKETFIWTGAEYDPQTDLLAVPGCFWGCPYSVVAVDFRNPLKAAETWLDLRSLIDPEYERFDDVEFAGWIGGGLSVRALDCETCSWRLIELPAQRIYSGLYK